MSLWVCVISMSQSSLGCVYNDGLCASLSERAKINRLDERDVSLHVSMASDLIPGIDLNTVIFDTYGYVQNSTNIVKQVMDSGFRRIYFDVYYDSVNSDWHMCPYRPPNGTFYNTTSVKLPNNIVCDYSLGVDQLLAAIKEYINLSDTNIAASIIYIHIRPKIWSSTISNSTIVPSSISSLNATFTNSLSQRILTPSFLASYQSSGKLVTTDGVSPDTPRNMQWPTLQTSIYTTLRRIVVSYNNDLSYIPDVQYLEYVAFPHSVTVEDPSSYTIEELSLRNFTDTFVQTTTQWEEAKSLGISPVFNATIDVFGLDFSALVEYYGFWAWAPDEPVLYSIAEREYMLRDGFSQSQTFDACAVVTAAGLKVANCNSHFQCLCKNRKNSFDWRFSEDNHTYFDNSCPKGYSFSVPSSALEMRYVKSLMQEKEVDIVWADFNSLFLPNCWVSGGTEAVCPYNVYEDDRNGVGFIAVSCAICFACLVFIFYFEWDRRHSSLMKKRSLKGQKQSNEYEGVPS